MLTEKRTADTPAQTPIGASDSPNGYTAPQWRNKLNIHQRVLAVIEALSMAGPIAREGVNTQQSYRFASHNAIKEALAPVLVRYGILHTMTPTFREGSTRTQPGSMYNGNMSAEKTVFCVRIEWEMQLINVDKPKDRIIITAWPSYAEDYGDKAESKAATIGEKTFLVKQFKIATTDEDTDGGIDQTRARRTTVRPVPPPPPSRPQTGAAHPHPSAPTRLVQATAPPSLPKPTTTASAPPTVPPPSPPAIKAAPASVASTSEAAPVSTPVSPSAEETIVASAENEPVATVVASPPDATIPTFTEEGLLLLALPQVSESAIRTKIRSLGLKDASIWTAKNHRRYCPLCAEFTRLSAMIATHQPSASPNEAKADDLPPLAR